ncbi:M64 family metallopeptidase [Arthrobacter sp. H41]|uniref:M64 family metallopeptidase n=1 Tax=Arthrobacter sp. H41 TaxID=1312978 RepID=UPI00047C7B2E|nr:M64 family metallopeptidase [Arthrobacter sp. H41]
MTTSDGSVLGTTQIRGSAPRNRAFNVVLLGDGFRAGEQAAFDTACTALANAFLGTPPFNELAPAINIFRVNVSSTDTGGDDPASAGGTGAIARTYFDAATGSGGCCCATRPPR